MPMIAAEDEVACEELDVHRVILGKGYVSDRFTLGGEQPELDPFFDAAQPLEPEGRVCELLRQRPLCRQPPPLDNEAQTLSVNQLADPPAHLQTVQGGTRTDPACEVWAQQSLNKGVGASHSGIIERM